MSYSLILCRGNKAGRPWNCNCHRPWNYFLLSRNLQKWSSGGITPLKRPAEFHGLVEADDVVDSPQWSGKQNYSELCRFCSWRTIDWRCCKSTICCEPHQHNLRHQVWSESDRLMLISQASNWKTIWRPDCSGRYKTFPFQSCQQRRQTSNQSRRQWTNEDPHPRRNQRDGPCQNERNRGILSR